MEAHSAEIRTTIGAGMLAVVGVLGIPAVLYCGLRGPLGASTANDLTLGKSISMVVLTLLAVRWWAN